MFWTYDKFGNGLEDSNGYGRLNYPPELVWPDDPNGPGRLGNPDGLGRPNDPDRPNQPDDTYELVMPVKFVNLIDKLVRHVRVVGSVKPYESLGLLDTFKSPSLPDTPRSPNPVWVVEPACFIWLIRPIWVARPVCVVEPPSTSGSWDPPNWCGSSTSPGLF